VNGDGYSDIVVGAHHADQMDGRAYVYLWNPSGTGSLQIGGILFGDPGVSPELFGITVALAPTPIRSNMHVRRTLAAGMALLIVRP
jgi:hypothetical protein